MKTEYAYDLSYDQTHDARIGKRSQKIALGKAMVYLAIVLTAYFMHAITGIIGCVFVILIGQICFLEGTLCKLTDLYDRHIIRMDRNSQILEQHIEQLAEARVSVPEPFRDRAS